MVQKQRLSQLHVLGHWFVYWRIIPNSKQQKTSYVSSVKKTAIDARKWPTPLHCMTVQQDQTHSQFLRCAQQWGHKPQKFEEKGIPFIASNITNPGQERVEGQEISSTWLHFASSEGRHGNSVWKKEQPFPLSEAAECWLKTYLLDRTLS